MKIINRPQVVVPIDDVLKLITKFMEKKTGKKVVNIDLPANAAGLVFHVDLQPEETDLEEPKNG